ncbi:MAG: GNAT family N-acetyltransferase [Acidimicrobiales bacterium]
MLSVRRCDGNDVSQLALLRFQWRSIERGEHGMDEEAFQESLEHWMREHETSHVAFLGLDDERPVGMAWLAIVDRVPGPEFFVRRSGYVQSVYVVATERSKGVGTALMAHVVDFARESGLDYLAVHPSEESFDFYLRLGFAHTTRVLELRERNVT